MEEHNPTRLQSGGGGAAAQHDDGATHAVGFNDAWSSFSSEKGGWAPLMRSPREYVTTSVEMVVNEFHSELDGILCVSASQKNFDTLQDNLDQSCQKILNTKSFF